MALGQVTMTASTTIPMSKVARTEAAITRLGFGGASVGNLYRASSNEQANAVLAAAIDQGVTYIDTAPHYGHGLSEVRIGKFLKSIDRSQVQLSTKVGRLLVPAGEEGPGDYGFVDPLPFDHIFDYSYDGVLQSFDESCVRLGVETLDILYMHDIGAVTHGPERHPDLFKIAMDGGYRAMAHLKETGRVKAIGLGVNEWDVCMESFAHADFDVFMLAGRYTLLEQTPLETFFPECAKRSVSILNASPFNSGLLARRPDETAHYNYAAAPPQIVRRAQRIFDVCEAHGANAQAAAIQFALAHPVIVGIVNGMSAPNRVTSTVDWFREELPASLWSDLVSENLLSADAPIPEMGPENSTD